MKLFASFANAVSLGLIGFAVLRPLTGAGGDFGALTVLWAGAGLVLHGVAHWILDILRQEKARDDV